MFIKKILNKINELGLKNFYKHSIDFIKIKYKMRKGYFIHKTAKIENKKNIFLGKNAEIQEYVIIRAHHSKVIIGNNSQINPFTVIYGFNNIHIGDDVMIAPHCMIVSGNHDYKQIDKPMRHAKEFSKGDIIIGNGAWIGANCTITDGVKIGANAVVAANSVVLNDIGEYDVFAGCPAKFVYNRKIKFKS